MPFLMTCNGARLNQAAYRCLLFLCLVISAHAMGYLIPVGLGVAVAFLVLMRVQAKNLVKLVMISELKSKGIGCNWMVCMGVVGVVVVAAVVGVVVAVVAACGPALCGTCTLAP